jgi:hypothetical protein
MNSFSIWHLFRDEQRKVVHQILEVTQVGIEASYRKIYEDHNPVMNFLSAIHIPKSIFVAAEHIINVDMKRLFEKEEIEKEELKRLIIESSRWGITLERPAMEYQISLWVTGRMEKVFQNPEDVSLVKDIITVLELLEPLSLNLNFWKAQNMYFSLREGLQAKKGEVAAQGDGSSKEWVDSFDELGERLRIKVS